MCAWAEFYIMRFGGVCEILRDEVFAGRGSLLVVMAAGWKVFV